MAQKSTIKEFNCTVHKDVDACECEVKHLLNEVQNYVNDSKLYLEQADQKIKACIEQVIAYQDCIETEKRAQEQAREDEARNRERKLNTSESDESMDECEGNEYTSPAGSEAELCN